METNLALGVSKKGDIHLLVIHSVDWFLTQIEPPESVVDMVSKARRLV